MPYLEIQRLREVVRTLERRISELEMALAMSRRLAERALDGCCVDVEQIAASDRIERGVGLDGGWN